MSMAATGSIPFTPAHKSPTVFATPATPCAKEKPKSKAAITKNELIRPMRALHAQLLLTFPIEYELVHT